MFRIGPYDQLRRGLCFGIDTQRIDGRGFVVIARPTVEELRLDLRAVLKKCRPDWDISNPDLKAAWARGEKNRFYPYGTSYAKTFSEQD